jgi:aryl-alcohol dehydrogenase-like predicted oxidoreductase
VTAPIASATNVTQLRELLDATNLNLDRESIELLDRASANQASASAPD